ncbi:hypothetical protein IPG41_00970 [Candidatus Peregrinibacteria bacterium]|nr:MAG: hypothetical protein IPG41_00970 [Candidatus Peregrinibacteria bacterium]
MQDFDHKRDEVMKDLKDHFKPEFLNRIDNIIVFRPLTHELIKGIVEIHLQDLQKHLRDKHLALEMTPEALDTLATLSTDPDYGARPVRRKVQELIEDPLAQGILDGEFTEGSSFKSSKKGTASSFKKAPLKENPTQGLKSAAQNPLYRLRKTK